MPSKLSNSAYLIAITIVLAIPCIGCIATSPYIQVDQCDQSGGQALLMHHLGVEETIFECTAKRRKLGLAVWLEYRTMGGTIMKSDESVIDIPKGASKQIVLMRDDDLIVSRFANKWRFSMQAGDQVQSVLLDRPNTTIWKQSGWSETGAYAPRDEHVLMGVTYSDNDGPIPGISDKATLFSTSRTTIAVMARAIERQMKSAEYQD
jgi:hypothetical protein